MDAPPARTGTSFAPYELPDSDGDRALILGAPAGRATWLALASAPVDGDGRHPTRDRLVDEPRGTVDLLDADQPGRRTHAGSGRVTRDRRGDQRWGADVVAAGPACRRQHQGHRGDGDRPAHQSWSV